MIEKLCVVKTVVLELAMLEFIGTSLLGASWVPCQRVAYGTQDLLLTVRFVEREQIISYGRQNTYADLRWLCEATIATRTLNRYNACALGACDC